MDEDGRSSEPPSTADSSYSVLPSPPSTANSSCSSQGPTTPWNGRPRAPARSSRNRRPLRIPAARSSPSGRRPHSPVAPSSPFGSRPPSTRTSGDSGPLFTSWPSYTSRSPCSSTASSVSSQLSSCRSQPSRYRYSSTSTSRGRGEPFVSRVETKRYAHISEESEEETEQHTDISEESGGDTERYTEITEESGGEAGRRYVETREDSRGSTEQYPVSEESGGETERYVETRGNSGGSTVQYVVSEESGGETENYNVSDHSVGKGEPYEESMYDSAGETPYPCTSRSTSSFSSPEDCTDICCPIVLWVKDKPFEFGTIPVYHSGKISLPILVKMVAYCRQKEWTETLPLGAWYHVCKTKLKLSYHIGWIYIRLFNILYQQMDRGCGDLNENGKWDERCNFLKSKKYDGEGKFEVPTMQFVLFLYLQHSYRMMSKHGPPPPSATYSEGLTPLEEPHFSDSSDDEFDERVVEKEEKKIIDENLQLRFVSSHLEVILSLLETGLPASPRLELQTVDVLNLLLCGADADDITGETMSLKEVIMRGGYAGYDECSHTVDRRLFIRWVKTALRVNPYGPSTGYLKSTIPGLFTGLIDEFRYVHARRENRIMCNKSTAPFCWYTISHVSKQVLFLKDIPIQADIRLYQCTDSFIYIIGSFSCVAVEWCRDCTIFLGCISGVLRVTGCQGIRLIAVARQIIINETIWSAFNVHTPCSPILAGNSITQLHFGPYNSHYPNLQLDMRLAKIGPILSQWDRVRGMSFEGLPIKCDHQWSPIEGKSFLEFNFPFYVPGSTTYNPILLQARHAWALEKNRRALRKWTSDKITLEDSGLKLDPLQSQLFFSILLLRFTNFLLTRGYHHEIVSLVYYNEASLQNCPRDPRWFDFQPETLDAVIQNLVFVVEKKIRKLFPKQDEEDTDGDKDNDRSLVPLNIE